ncbi:MAG: hypothetical protein IK114_02990 [Fibrobacter sp.]|nr:hypothetical protein [Fibrobacter sp.]
MKKFLIASLSFLFSLVACTDYQAEYEDKYEALVSEPIEVLDSSAKETIIDTRDNQVYEVVQIGTQKWLARNLNYNDGKGKCPSDDKSLCKMYGRLYNANSIIKVHKSDKANGDQEIYDSLRALCPEGWHVPFKSEWKILKDYVAKQGHKGEVGKALKSVDGWFAADSMVELSKDDIRFAVASGNDPYGFKALPAGICRDSECSSFDNAYFWGVADTVRESFAMMLVGYAISFENDDFVRDGNINYLNNPRVSVRCIEGARQEAYFDSSSMKKVNDVSKKEISSSSEESSEVEKPSEENTEKSSDSAVKSSSSVVPSSASVANSSSSVTKSSSSVASSSTSVIRSSSSIVKSKLDCSLYNCVTTEYLNQDMLAAGLYGEYLDTRDNQVYRTIEIGTQTWFAQNLNYESIKSECYEGSAANCKKYGRLYLQSEATEVCPTGWHLPSEAEWEVLNAYVDEINGTDAVGTSLKALDVWDGISSVPAGKDLVGFSGLPSHYFGSVLYCGSSTHGLYWTADKNEYRCLLSDNSILYDNIDSYAYTYGMSVRCLKGTAQTTTKSSSSSAVAPKSSSSVSNAAKGRLFVDLGDKVYSANTSGSPVTVNLVGMPDTSSLDYIAIYFEPNMSGGYARDLNIRTGKDEIYRMRQHMYASNKAPVVQENGYVTSFTPVVDMSTDNLDDKTVHYYWSGWTSGLGHFKIVFDREELVFYLYVEDTYLGYGTLSKDPIVMDNIELAREQPYGTNTCQVSNVRVAGFSTLEAAKAWDGVAF